MGDTVNIDTRNDGDVTIVEIDGDVDARTGPMLLRNLDEILAAGNNKIVLDLEKVDFMDSMGISVLLTFHKRIRFQNGTVTLARLQEPVRKVFELTRLDQVFKTHNDVEGAVASLR